MVLLDGKKLALMREETMKEEVAKLREEGITPALAVILVGDDAASSTYVNMKTKACHRVGIDSVTETYHSDIKQDQLLSTIKRLNEDPRIDGILVQLPLPKHINTQLILESIAPHKDVDGFHPYNIGRMQVGLDSFLPATPMGVMELLEHYDIDILGKDIVIVGASNIVGKPLASMMLQKGATISVCHIHTKDLASYTKNADIVCVGVGKPNLINKEMLKQGAILVDIGINRLESGELTGDASKDVEQVCSYLTPVPGGVGPLTISSLLKNTIIAAKINKNINKI